MKEEILEAKQLKKYNDGKHVKIKKWNIYK